MKISKRSWTDCFCIYASRRHSGKTYRFIVLGSVASGFPGSGPDAALGVDSRSRPSLTAVGLAAFPEIAQRQEIACCHGPFGPNCVGERSVRPAPGGPLAPVAAGPPARPARAGRRDHAPEITDRSWS